MLEAREGKSSRWVFPSDTGNPYVVTSLDHMHAKLRAPLRLPKDFVIHSLRHTFGTRMGEAGAGAFEIMRLMGHSSVTVSQRYVHPSPESLERAFERLEAMNAQAVGKSSEEVENGPNRLLPPTISPTPSADSQQQASKSLRAHSSAVRAADS